MESSKDLPVPPDVTDLIAFDPVQMEYDSSTMTARFIQNCQIRMTKEIIQGALKFASDKQLRDELNRRTEQRKQMKARIFRCRDCVHCIQGYTSRHAFFRGYKTSVCEIKPKDKAFADCFYATLRSRKACEQFEPKTIK